MCNECQIISESVFDCAHSESECLTEVKFYPTLNVNVKICICNESRMNV